MGNRKLKLHAKLRSWFENGLEKSKFCMHMLIQTQCGAVEGLVGLRSLNKARNIMSIMSIRYLGELVVHGL